MPEPEETIVQRLVREVGVSEAQANQLILLIGLNWASLMREAKELNRSVPGLWGERARS
jgi:hypothetical protein